MKIIILRKKIILFLIIILILFSSIYICIYTPFSLAVELTDNSVIDESLKEKISTLTQQNEKIAYLTFDDGPTLKATSKILDILNEENIKASFFVVGKHVKEHPELVKRSYEEGHYIANHGYNHDNSKLYKNSESFISEVKNTDIEISNAIGIDNYCSHIFRFPYGYMSAKNKTQKKEAVKLLSNMNYTYIDWNCLNNDSVKKYSNCQLLNNLKKSAKNKGTLVILMHDTSDVNDTPSILKDSINYLKEQGYEFKNFYNLLDNYE
jgi:peptidoglycan/xylan/chitin deacetylase (PgdA/CDA1 family)